ncbi:hypothetical protein BAOM_3049 [Peribacillus asahii]|uniref:Uncharacterized protein n=1 Tax=Peribacillus asahii TaxID=228899 RepID=A0A3T0KTK3_9BACI|nr:hypothetical protein [Peribacillus asahii]AZV43658.1 hypothetical protein BAOM_3049 [Peribacillus asahii]
MTIDPRELLLKMKEYDFIYDTKLGKIMNKKSEEDKYFIFKILDLLYDNFDRVKYTDDLSESVIGKEKWGILISQKFAISDKRMPIPQVPFNLLYSSKLISMSLSARQGYYTLVGLLLETDEDIYVMLNFRDEKYRKEYKRLTKEKKKVK